MSIQAKPCLIESFFGWTFKILGAEGRRPGRRSLVSGLCFGGRCAAGGSHAYGQVARGLGLGLTGVVWKGGGKRLVE
jgi:hypothetical protein